MATAILEAFNARVTALIGELEELRRRNMQERAYKPTFWTQHADFTLARDVFVAACGTIEHETTKFSLIYAKPDAPSVVDATSICKAMQGPSEQLLAACKVALFSGVGPSLAEDILQQALRVLKSVSNVGETALKKEIARVPEMTGRVWESCKAVKNLPKSNCIATKRSMLQCVSIAKDTIEELKERLEDNGEDVHAGESFDEIDADDDFAFESSLAPEDKEAFESGLKLLEMLAAVLKRGVMAVKNLAIEEDQKDLITWTASLDIAFRDSHTAIIDMGAALYPPVDMAEVNSALAAVERAGPSLLQCLIERPSLDQHELEALERGLVAFTQQVAQVRSRIQPRIEQEASECRKYSIWLVPEASAATELEGTIEELATRLETPKFKPHMTLLGGIESSVHDDVVTNAKAVASKLPQVTVDVEAVSTKDLYFQSIFALLQKTSVLDSAYAHATEVFAPATASREFMPHISLVYGEHSAETRHALQTELAPRWDARHVTMERLQVWTTSGPVAQWQLVADYPLGC